MIEYASAQKRKVAHMIAEQMPEFRTVAAWEFHLFPGLLLWVVICWRGHRSLIGSYKFLGVLPVLVWFGGKHENDYRIITPLGEEEA